MVYTLFVVLIVIVSLLMIGIVLIQESKGGGLSSNFSSSNAIMGVRKTTDFVEKATWTLAGLMVICAYVAPTASTERSVMEQAATQNQATNATNTQGFGASQQAAPKASDAKAVDTKTAAPKAAEAPATPAK